MYRVKLTLRDTPKAVTALSEATQLNVAGNDVRGIVEEIHEVIVVKY